MENFYKELDMKLSMRSVLNWIKLIGLAVFITAIIVFSFVLLPFATGYAINHLLFSLGWSKLITDNTYVYILGVIFLSVTDLFPEIKIKLK